MRIFILFFFILAQSSIFCQEGTKFSIIEDQATLPILTPSFIERKTLKICLENGLKAYLVSDPYLDKSSAVIAVKTGSWENPKEYPGIAHFLEHMLFLGTKKYPEESEYHRFISDHGGLANAFTANDRTSYLFSINNQAFVQTLDRFASFFIEPLFNPSGVSRELQAIDQEYAKNIENDEFREYYIFKALSDAKHPNRSFCMGNRSTLANVSQETLKKWYQEHYSSNRMHLVVFSTLPLEELKAIVVEKFSEIPNRNLPQFDLQQSLIDESAKGCIVHFEPIKNSRKLNLIWEVPPKFVDMLDIKPEHLISHILGHEGKESLLAKLKKDKLAESIKSGGDRIGGHNFAFSVEISLTDAGVKNVDQVILLTFEAIANLKRRGIPQYIFDELQTMSKLNYQYQAKEDAFEHIFKHAMWAGFESLETYPEETLTLKRYDPAILENFLSYLTPKNCLFQLCAPQNLTGVTYDQKEPWLKIPYSLKPLSKELMQAYAQAKPNPEIDLPDPNPFIPNTFSFNLNSYNSMEKIGSQIPIPHPKLILQSDHGKIYFSQDFHYAIPKVQWSFEIKTPAIHVADPETIVLADLFVKYANDSLSHYTYPASLAGLDFDIQRTNDGLAITIDGYNDKADLLFIDLLKGLKGMSIRENKFKNFKDALQRQYANASVEKPVTQAYETLKSILFKEFCTEKSKLLACKKISFDRFESFTNQLFARTYIEGMLYGNMLEESARKVSDQMQVILGSDPYPKNEHHKMEVIILPQNEGPFFVEASCKVQGNAAILAIQADGFSLKGKAAQQILMQAMKEPFFSNLRTKQQTGYIVSSQSEEIEGQLFNLFAVQSSTHDGRDLLARFELFIEDFMQDTDKKELSIERFEKIKQTLLTTLKQPPNNLNEMGTLLHKLAFVYKGDFNLISKRIQAFEELSYQEFLEHAKEFVGKQNKRRIGILLNGVLGDEALLKYKKTVAIGLVRKLGHYQAFRSDTNE